MASTKNTCLAFLAAACALGAAKETDSLNMYDGLQAIRADISALEHLESKASKCTVLSDDLDGVFAVCPQTEDLTSVKGAKVLEANAGEFIRRTAGVAEPWGKSRARSAQSLADSREEWYGAWRTPEDMMVRVREIVDHSNGTAVLEELADFPTHEGRLVPLVRMRGANFKPGGPRLLLNFLIHAREWLSGSTGMYTLENFVERAKADSLWLQDAEVIIIPITNPDGFAYSHTTDRLWRKNRSPIADEDELCIGTDLNRQWTGGPGSDWTKTGRNPCLSSYGGSAPISEPESKALEHVFAESQVSVHLDTHTSAQNILPALGYTMDPLHERHVEIERMSHLMRQAAESMGNHDYPVGYSCELLSCSHGLFKDYSMSLGALGVTVELPPRTGDFIRFAPPAALILPVGKEWLLAYEVALDFAKKTVSARAECSADCMNLYVGDGFCDTACNNDACGFDGGDCAGTCSPDCPADKLANLECDPGCNTTACGFDNGNCAYEPTCAPGCPTRLLNDGYCHMDCNVDACGNDGTDCIICAPGCKVNWPGDDYCDPECNNEACNFDAGDCAGLDYCNNGKLDNEETQQDCGGPNCAPCGEDCAFLASTGSDELLGCTDGTTCNITESGWGCCTGKGGRSQCPDHRPVMCDSPTACVDGTDRCCTARGSRCSGSGAGGARLCLAEPDNSFVRSFNSVVHFEQEDLFEISATKDACMKHCLATSACVGVDYGFGLCYGKSAPMAMGEKVHSENFFHFEKK